MKLLYLHVRDSESLFKDTSIHFDPKWRFEEKGDEKGIVRLFGLGDCSIGGENGRGDQVFEVGGGSRRFSSGDADGF